MDCREATELLPWYLNGMLDERERRDLRGHLDGCARCREELTHTREAAALFDSHLAPAEIVMLTAGEPPPGPQTEELLSHVAECAECTEELALAREGLQAVAAAPDPVSSRPARRLWAAGGVAAAAFLAGVATTRLWAPGPTGDGPRVAALESEVNRLHGELARARDSAGPQKNLPVIELLPQERAVRGPEGPSVPPSPSGRQLAGPFAAVSLVYDGRGAYDDYQLQVDDPAGRVVWSADGMARQPDGDFTALLPMALVRGDRHTLRLSGRRGTSWVALATYVLDLRPAGK
jgi:hypothetical protein